MSKFVLFVQTVDQLSKMNIASGCRDLNTLIVYFF